MRLDPAVVQSILAICYPLVEAILLLIWGMLRINGTGLPASRKWMRRGYIFLLGLLVFPGSVYLFIWFTEPCYGMGSGVFNLTHRAVCGNEITQGLPVWGIILYSVDLLVLFWAIRSNTKDSRGQFIPVYLPVLYFTILRFTALALLSGIENPLPF